MKHLILTLGVLMNSAASADPELYTLVSHEKLSARKPDSMGKNVKVWNIKQNEKIRINLVEMSGELSLHKHPDAEHSLMVLEGQVRVQIGEKSITIGKGDFISIPAGVPHKYWSLTKVSKLVSMDAPYYDPRKTIPLE